MAFYGAPRRHHRRGVGDVFVAMMFAQLLRRIEQLPYKPPVTLFLMAVMAAVHWSPSLLQPLFPGARTALDFAFNPFMIVQQEQWHRMWTSPLVHLDAMHLYCEWRDCNLVVVRN